MSADEPEGGSKRRMRRRSLRVPVDEVPRPTAPPIDDGSATMEMPAFADSEADRVTMPEMQAYRGSRPDLSEAGPEVEELSDEDLGAPREDEELDELEESPTLVRNSPLEEAEAERAAARSAPPPPPPPASRPPAAAVEPSSVEIDLEDIDEDIDDAEPADEASDATEAVARAEDQPSSDAPAEAAPGADPERVGPEAGADLPSDIEARETSPGDAPAPEAPAPEDAPADETPGPEVTAADEPSASDEEESADDAVTPAEAPRPEETPAAAEPPRRAAVVVQRVVAIASSVTGPVPAAPPAEEGASLDGLSDVDVDIDEPTLTIDESAETALEFDDGDDEVDEELTELVEESLDDEGEPSRPSKPPPPPASKAAPPPAPAAAAPPTPPAAARAAPSEPSAVAKRKKPRRAWWELLFTDDYLRTVPIPHPKTIASQCDFIEQRLGLAQGATILDVGCGLGLHAIELQRRGYIVVGIDFSPTMLARARNEAEDHGLGVTFLEGDMREMAFDISFDAILCWGTTFGYFDDETNRQVIDRLYSALKPRGHLLLDVVNRDYVIRGQPNLVWFEGDGCVVMEETQVNYINSRLQVKRNVILDDGRQRDSVYSLRLYAPHELGQLLHQQGFRVVELSGLEAHPGVFFGQDSPKLIILAERRPQGPPTPPGRSESGSEPAPPPEEAAPPTEAELEELEPEPEEPEEAAPATPVEPSDAVREALAETLESSEASLDEEPDEGQGA